MLDKWPKRMICNPCFAQAFCDFECAQNYWAHHLMSCNLHPAWCTTRETERDGKSPGPVGIMMDNTNAHVGINPSQPPSGFESLLSCVTEVMEPKGFQTPIYASVNQACVKRLEECAGKLSGYYLAEPLEVSPCQLSS